MTRGFKVFCTATLALALLILGLLLSVSQWLPRLAGIWLPQDTRIILDGNPRWRNGGIWLPGIRYAVGDCEIAAVQAATLTRHAGRWQAVAEKVALNSHCLGNLPASNTPTTPRSVAEWQALLPGADITIRQFVISPYETYAGELQLALDAQHQKLRYSGENLELELNLTGQQLAIQRLKFNYPALKAPVMLSGKIRLPAYPEGMPQVGALQGNVILDTFPQPLTLAMNWRQKQGQFTVYQQDDKQPLLIFPWRVSGETIAIQQGQWRWPYAIQPLSGGVNLTLSQWRQGLQAMEIRARLNMVTQGRGGKGNIVLSLGPGRLDPNNSQLPFQLTGESKLANLQFYTSMPGMLAGSVLNPYVTLQPGALLRMRGRLLSTLEVDEARWPLAGVKVSSSGIDGRLQAILNAHDPQMGRFDLHLDGRASDFWPDKGRWVWRYWGKGEMAPLAAKWDVGGTGSWQDTMIELNTLSTGFDRLSYGMVDVKSPRLTLNAPVRWERSAETPSFNGELQLAARETRFSSGGYLPPSTLNMVVKGRDPSDFIYNGALEAGAIGPVRVNGRWDGDRLRGQAWWPQQSLTVFQPLLSPDSKMKIQSGTLNAQVAFSAASEQGFEAGGHWVVKDGSVWMPDNEINGIDFSLPFRLKTHQWYFGTRGPVSLRIHEIKNQFAMRNFTADLQGWYPWNDKQPLDLMNVNVDILGGQLSMAQLGLPQRAAALLRLHNISLSELITALKPKQIAMSGRINGELPLWLNHPQWLIKDGWIANSGNLTLRLDDDMANTISNDNIAAGLAIDWLRYMEISRSWATLNLDNLGNVIMKAEVDGSSRFHGQTQRVTLNYSHHENLFQLWRSLRFGDNLQSWVEQNATLPSQKENNP
ncbi:hypothetical protein ED28_01415 [[Pantoea] beijingensis]|uniref:Uncharacterized protein n=1 Tax=[Pantoea] beijingensis TaxID=1324864 RepID=A0A443II19_9GAMM|nr:YdbH family protein [[Pantoea] beijingensis]RWR03673.1 hypothetical protein ED28_01415 [[Pantoea] beijingensis]